MEQPCTVSAESCAQYVIPRIAAVSFFLITGIVGNGIVLKIYHKEKKQASKIYIIALAWIDLLGCVVILPQVLVWQSRVFPIESPFTYLYFAEVIIQKQSYLFVQIAMVLDRIFAVFKPHSFNEMRRKTNKTLVVVFIMTQAVSQSAAILFNITHRVVYGVVMTLAYITPFPFGFTLMLVAYPAIAMKLWKQSRRIKPTAANQQNQPSAATGNPNKVISETQQRTKHHVKTLKLYVAVLALFLVTFVTAMILSLGDSKLNMKYSWLSYIYYFNSIGNPFIYYIFNEKFRDDVKLLFGKPA